MYCFALKDVCMSDTTKSAGKVLLILKQYACLQDGLFTIPESTSKPISASNPPESEPPASGPPEYESFSGCASDRRGTDDQRNNAWSAKEKVPKSAARLKKAVEKLQPSEETRRKFCERRHQKRRHVVQGLRQICRTMTPCFQNQAVQH